MGAVFKFYKRRFRNALEPVFVMLIAKKNEMDVEQWNSLVEKVAGRILENPNEFLGNDLPENPTMCDVLYEIFEQFMKEKGSGKSAFEKVAAKLVQSRNFNS